MVKQIKGQLVGVGVGPGDPELVSRKGWKVVNEAKIIAYPAPDQGQSFARQIVAEAISEKAVEIPMIIPMSTNRAAAETAYDGGARKIANHLDRGQDVVVLCEGDPLFYGSFIYILGRLTPDYECKIIPGITSIMAVSAVARRPLVSGNERFSVVTGTSDNLIIEQAIKSTTNLAIMKVGRHLPRLSALIEALGLMDNAWYVSHASLPSEQSCPLAEAPANAPYFSMLLITGQK